MDDSLDAFQTPHLKRPKSISMARKNRNLKSKIVVDKKIDNIVNDVDDTMYGLGNLDNSSESSSNTVSSKSNTVAVGSCDVFSSPKPSSNIKNISDLHLSVAYSPGGICSLCNRKIEKENCELHRRNCMKLNFGSRRTLKCQLSSKLKCKYCCKEVMVSSFEAHVNECKEKTPTIKSSYFSSSNNEINAVLCPTCNLDLSNFDEPKRNHHVNKCLDKATDSAFETTSKVNLPNLNEKFSCSHCSKTFKTSRGLKIHAKRQHKDAGVDAELRTSDQGCSESLAKSRNFRTPKNKDEENLNIAKALSASECSDKKLKKKKGKKNKKEPEIPCMIQVSPTTKRKAFGERLQNIFEKKDDDYEISSTPQLPLFNSNKWKLSANQQNDEILESHAINIEPTDEKKDKSACQDNLNSPCHPPFVVLSQGNKNFKSKTNQEAVSGDASKPELNEQNHYLGLPTDAEKCESSSNSNVLKESKFSKKKGSWLLSSCKDFSVNDFRVEHLLTNTQFGPIKEFDFNQRPENLKQSNDLQMLNTTTKFEYGDTQNEIEFMNNLNELEAEANKSTHFSPMQNSDSEKHKELISMDISPNKPNLITNNTAGTTLDNSEIINEESEKYSRLQENYLLSLNSIGQDLNDNKNSQLYSDLTLTFGSGPKIYLHKFILHCRCPDLLKVLEKASNNDNICEITDCSYSQFKTVVDYIYSGKTDNVDVLQEIVEKIVNTKQSDIADSSPAVITDCNEQNCMNTTLQSSGIAVSVPKIDVNQSFPETETTNEHHSNIISTSKNTPTNAIQDDRSPTSNTEHENRQSQNSPINNDASNNSGGFCVGWCDVSVGGEIQSDEDLFDPPCWIPAAENETRSTPPITSQTPLKPFANKRMSNVITPCLGNRSKTMRMTGSTPKWDNIDINKQNLFVDVEIHDVSSIVGTPNLYPNSKQKNLDFVAFGNLSTLQDKLNKTGLCNAEKQNCEYHEGVKNNDDVEPRSFNHDVCEIEASDDDVIVIGDTKKPEEEHRKSVNISFSQPIFSSNSNENCGTISIPKPKYKFRKTKKKSIANLEWEEFPSSLNSQNFISSPKLAKLCQESPEIHNKHVTPKIRKRRNSTGNSFTPMPNYSDMDTPNILECGKKIGLKKALGKKKTKVKLVEAYAWKHQYVYSPDEDEEIIKKSCDTPLLPKNRVDSGENGTSLELKGKKLFSDLNSDSDEELDLIEQRRCKIEDFVRKSVEKLEALSIKDFSAQMLRALNLLKKSGHLQLALERERKQSSGIQRSFRAQIDVWMDVLNVDSKSFNQNFSILLRLSKSKQDALSEVLTTFSRSHSHIEGIHLHLLNVIPIIYNAMLRLNPSLLPPT